MKTKAPSKPSSDVEQACPADIPAHDARSLLGGGEKAEILLGDQRYLLRITKAGKLILTK